MSSEALLILCGGQGTRLASVWREPKVLAPIEDKSYLELLISNLNNLDIQLDITLATGFKSDVIESKINSLSLPVNIIREKIPLGTGGAILNFIAQSRLTRFSIMNGDTLFSIRDLNAYFQHIKKTTKSVFSACKIDRNDRYGSISVEPHVSIHKPTHTSKNDLIYAGLSTINASSLLAEEVRCCAFEELVNQSKISRNEMDLFLMGSGFHDIGTPSSLVQAATWLKKN